jgi:hypothetical protein
MSDSCVERGLDMGLDAPEVRRQTDLMFSYDQQPQTQRRPWLPSPGADRVLMLSDPKKRSVSRKPSEQAERVVARLLARDAAYAAKVARVRRCQARLRGQSSPLSWRLYLQLEEAEVGRWTHALERVASWALASRSKARR